jgi:hypothetical protein
MDGGVNLFAYVGGQPTGWTDPSGLVAFYSLFRMYGPPPTGRWQLALRQFWITLDLIPVGAGLKGPAAVVARLCRARSTTAAAKASAASVADKLERNLLNLEHPVGGSKAQWFEAALGFTRANAADLARQLVFDSSKAVKTGVTQYGTKFNQTIEIVGANGKTIPVTTAWIRGEDGVVRLITAVPGK